MKVVKERKILINLNNFILKTCQQQMSAYEKFSTSPKEAVSSRRKQM